MRLTHYILDEKGDIKEEPDLLTWAKWLEENREARKIAWTNVGGEYNVSTCFLGLDHNFGFPGENRPILFETMVFEDKESEIDILGKKKKTHKTLDLDGMFDRYATREEAMEGHKRIVELVETYQQKNNVKENEQTKTVYKESEGTD